METLIIADKQAYEALIEILTEDGKTFKIEELEAYNKIHIKATPNELFWIGTRVGVRIAP